MRSREKNQRSTPKQILLGLLTNFSSIAPSMSLGFSAVALPTLTNPLNTYALTATEASWFASIASLATPFGSFFSGPISDRYGRRSALFCINIICFIGWITISAAYHIKEYQFIVLLIGRLLTGLSTGLSSMPATVYMAEVSSVKLRGVFTTWSSISFSLGVLIIYTLGFFLKDSWGTISLITAAFPCIGMAFAVFFIPESPTWLVNKGRYEEARHSMSKLYASKDYAPEIDEEVNALIQKKGVKINNGHTKSIFQQISKKMKYLLKPNALKPFLLIMVFFFFQQFTGIFAVVFYAINIVKNSGIEFDAYATIVLIGLVRFFSATSLNYICRKFGRRPLSIFSGVLMAICMLGLGVFKLQQNKIDDSLKNSLMFIPIVLLLVYFCTSTIGFLSMPFAMSAEVYPARVRGTASGISSCIAYIFSFITVKIYPSMELALHSEGVFFFYGGMAVIGTMFVYFFLPETKGKSFDEIEAYFVGKKDSKELEMEKLAA